MPSPVQTLSEGLDNLYTTTWQNMKGNAVDNIFDATPFWFWMKDKGRLKSIRGGRFITEPIVYAKNENIVWLTKGGTTSLNDYEFLTLATYYWRYVAAPIVRFGQDDQQNSGKNQIISLMNAKMENTQNSLIDELETKLASGDNSASNAMSGLQHLVRDDPTTSTEVGGINQSTYSWWQNKQINMTGVSFATSGVDKMRTMVNNCGNNRTKDRPDFILSGQVPYEYYEDAVLGKYQIHNQKLTDLGFDNLAFKGIPMVWSPAIADTRMYFLNTNFLYLVYDPAMFFDMTEWKPLPEQPNDRVAQIVSACEFVTSRRRVQGVIHTINTP